LGIVQELSAPHSPHQNSVAERMNRKLCEAGRAMCIAAELPKLFWAEAIAYEVWLHNNMVTKGVTDTTPHEAFKHIKPNLAKAHIFGCKVWVLNRIIKKWNSKAEACIYMLPANDGDAHCIYNPHTHKFIMSRDVYFGNEDFYYPSEFVEVEVEPKPDITENLNPIPELVNEDVDEVEGYESSEEQLYHRTPPASPKKPTSVSPVHATPSPVAPARNTRAPTIPTREASTRQRIEPERLSYASVAAVEPSTYKEAVKEEHGGVWTTAMDNEIKALTDRGTWKLTNLPPGRKPVSCKWVYKAKLKADGTVEHHKARLVA
jgi:hypothetical protein